MSSEEVAKFKVKELVEVSARTHPGFNFLGGTGRISKVHDERIDDGGPMKDGSSVRTTGYTYDIRYVIGGSEKRVDAQYIRSKVLATRQELGEARQEEVQRKKAEREAIEAEKRKQEAERLERKRRARQQLDKLRAAKKKKRQDTNKSIQSKPKRPKKQIQSTTSREEEPSAENIQEKIEEKEEEEELEDESLPISPELNWFQDILVHKVPRDPTANDEIDLDTLLTFINQEANPPQPIAQATDRKAIVIDFLKQLEASNSVMLIDQTIFIV